MLIIDTGSSVSLIQPGLSSARLTKAKVTPYGVTGEELQIRGEQPVCFNIDGQTYRHEFNVCSLSTDADAIIGTDFLYTVNARLDLETRKMWLTKSTDVRHASSEWRLGGTRGTADPAVLTVFSTPYSRDRPNSCLITSTKKEEEMCYIGNNDNVSFLATLREAEPWIVEITETVKIPPRVKKMVVGKIKFPKYHETLNLVCNEPAQMPYEGVLAARGLSPVLSAGDRSSEARMTSRRGRTNQLTIPDRADHVHVMLANFSEEELVIPKATVVGVAEEISPTLVAVINDDARPADKRNDRTHGGA